MIKSATLALALAAIAATAHAAPAPVAIQMSDLQMSTPAGVAEFDRRAEQAGRAFCNDATARQRLSERAACEVAVKQEIAEKLAARQEMAAQKAQTTLARR